MAHTFTSLLTHVIFSTKDRAPCIKAALKPRLFAYLGGIVRELKGKAFAVNGTSDHAHMLISLPPSTAVSDAVRVIKANSSGWVHELGAGYRTFAWQIGYGAFSVSQSNMSAVIKYIETQEEHHRKASFTEELVAFLKKHGIEYDERYIWE
ncbi:MAG TPA: IS200/IS605 family transposase [Pyrinomonadaceae bacterium]|jgi:REP element-mobilizing transposase RayT